MIIIKDDYGKDYKVPDLEAFKSHIEKYHTRNGKGDGSLHEENGYWFSVTDEFYRYVMSL
ncbi:hypothetical protein OA501_00035 [Flavobacteriaceae bacterium]|nr:hypothetical protein [Flavobacteriaceae bacterium]